MCMDQVEVICPAGDFLDKRSLESHGIGTGTTETEGSGTNWNELRTSHGISARKKRYVMTQIHELIDQPCDDPLSSSVKLRGRTFR